MMILNFSPGGGYEGWHDNWGLGIRIMVMGMPLRLDLGVPMSDPSNSGGSTQFTSQVGLVSKVMLPFALPSLKLYFS